LELGVQFPGWLDEDLIVLDVSCVMGSQFFLSTGTAVTVS